MSKSVTTVEVWQECISSLSDSKFFELMRLYLGEIETPYNKQRLIEQLAGFIKNPGNSDSMITLLDEYDIKLLTAIAFIPNATQDTLVQFFTAEYTMADIFSGLSNLTARLFVFEQKDEYSSKKYLRINPIIWEKLAPYIKLGNIISPAELAKTNIDDTFSISPDLLAAFISFINTKGCSCKADGVIKKNTLARIQSVFAGHEKTIQLLLTAFINLSLVREGEKSFVVDYERFELFAKLDSAQQYALLCAASCSRFSREGLKKEAQLLLDTLSSIQDKGFTLAALIRFGFLAQSQSGSGESGSSRSRFSRMLEAARQEQDGFALMDPQQAGSLLERMLDSAVEFGLLQKNGWDKEGHEVFICSQLFTRPEPAQNVLNIDSTFTVSLMPGLTLNKLLPLTQLLEIKSYGVVTEYEISRQSVSAAYDRGWTVEEICRELEKYTSYELPQNLKVCINEWFEAYSSAMIYKGYVLKVAKKNIGLVENAPAIKKHIKEKLAEGIYLLNIPLDSDIELFIEQSGLDFMGKVKDPFVPGEKLPFPVLRAASLAVPEPTSAVVEPVETTSTRNFSIASHLLQSLKQELKKMDLTKNQRECLENRIHNRLILTKDQLATTSIRSEILEADGMDFGGKLHLLEAGLKENDMMELTLPQFDKDDEYFKVIGRTLGITKQTGDAVIRFEVYPTHEITNFVVSRITYLRRLRF
ncbi:MAG: helicase-associated domain-containing protein [Treponema sp.]|nr:helicase-associated domain-containing protein [Treponema sp.]